MATKRTRDQAQNQAENKAYFNLTMPKDNASGVRCMMAFLVFFHDHSQKDPNWKQDWERHSKLFGEWKRCYNENKAHKDTFEADLAEIYEKLQAGDSGESVVTMRSYVRLQRAFVQAYAPMAAEKQKAFVEAGRTKEEYHSFAKYAELLLQQASVKKLPELTYCDIELFLIVLSEGSQTRKDKKEAWDAFKSHCAPQFHGHAEFWNVQVDVNFLTNLSKEKKTEYENAYRHKQSSISLLTQSGCKLDTLEKHVAASGKISHTINTGGSKQKVILWLNDGRVSVYEPELGGREAGRLAMVYFLRLMAEEGRVDAITFASLSIKGSDAFKNGARDYFEKYQKKRSEAHTLEPKSCHLSDNSLFNENNKAQPKKEAAPQP